MTAFHQLIRALGALPRPLRRWLRRSADLALDLKDRQRSQPRKVIWILSHMRSGSTLLMHLLSSHPEILGAGERNATYASAEDLRKLEVDCFVLRRQFARDFDFVVDQINHDRFLTGEDLLDPPRVKKIFLMRKPRATVASMVEVLGHFHGMSREEAISYYSARLRTLERYARRSHDHRGQAFLSYEELVAHPALVLQRLTAWLGLASDLEDSYRTFDFTGSRGDPSQHIRSGRIRGDLPPRRIELEPAVLERLESAHGRARAVLKAHCMDLQAPGTDL